MKKRAVVSLLLVITMLLCGCGSDNDEPASEAGALSDLTSDTESSEAESSSEASEEVSEEPQTVTNAQKWIDQIEDNSVILTYEQIQAHNKKIASLSPSIVDVTVFPSVLDGKTLKTYLNEISVPSLPKYNGSAKITEAQLDSYIANKNIDAVKDENNEVKRAVVSQRAALKSLPTDARFYKKANAGNFDQIMETGLYAGMPVLVLHTSADGKWYFVQSYFYRGWVSTEQIYITESDAEWNTFADKTDFVTVTEPLITVEGIKLDMGTTLPVAESDSCEFYKVYLPKKDGDGFVIGAVSTEYAVSGYLPMTRENILIQLFKYEGTSYGWGDDIDGVDCSSYTANVFRTFGFIFPRNASQQQSTVGGPSTSVSGFPDEIKEEYLDSFEGPYPCYLSGHVIIYLGRMDGKHYIIHSNATTMKVSETLLDMSDVGGKDYLKLLTWIAPIE